jgi:hypothetical protein
VFTGPGAVVFGSGSVSAINPAWGSGTDTAKTQWAVTTALASGVMPIEVSRKYTLTSAVTIDRAVDTTTNDLRIIGKGLDAGFYTASAISMFSSSIANTDDPVSEHISFENIRFAADSAATNCYVMDGNKFLRVKMNNCYFYGIRLANTDQYYQSWDITNSYLTGWQGTWWNATNGGGTFGGRFLDLHISHFKVEFGAVGNSKLIVSAGQIIGGAFTNSLVENFDGPVIETNGFAGFDISGNYFEAIVNPALKLGTTVSLSLVGNNFVDPSSAAWIAVDCETSANVYSSGNDSSAHLFDDSGMVRGSGDGLVSFGDVAVGNIYIDAAKNQLTKTGTLTGFTTTVQQLYYVTRNANVVTMSWDTQTGTSNATTMTLTGVIPTSWLPATQKSISIIVQDNGSWTTGLMVISSAGVSIYKDITAGTLPFTASGTKGIGRQSISYSIVP